MTRLEVTLCGEWVTGYPNRAWSGLVQAAEPLVALFLIRCGGRTEWAKTRPQPGSSLNFCLTLHLVRYGALDVQLIWRLGGGACARTQIRVPSLEYLPVVPARMAMAAGSLVEITSVTGDPPASLQGLFLANRDVEVRRAGIWRVRPSELGELPEFLREPLSRRRTGLLVTPGFSDRPIAVALAPP